MTFFSDTSPLPRSGSSRQMRRSSVRTMLDLQPTPYHINARPHHRLRGAVRIPQAFQRSERCFIEPGSRDANPPVVVRASNKGQNLDPYAGLLARLVNITVVRDGSLGPSLVNPDRNNIAPRLGLSYALGQKTVIRAGIGTFYDMLDMGNQSMTWHGHWLASSMPLRLPPPSTWHSAIPPEAPQAVPRRSM